MRNNENYMFSILKGTGSYPNSTNEGVLYNNFYGTYLIGPILIRNTELVRYLTRKIIMSKDKKFKFNQFNLIL